MKANLKKAKVDREFFWVLGTALGAAVVSMILGIPSARADLVFDDEVSGSMPTTEESERLNQNAAADRESNRSVLDVSERAIVTQQVAPQFSQNETQHFTKTELMRRERQRQELRNEDLLQARLEELRLRDEKRRTEEVLKGASGDVTGDSSRAQPIVALPVQEEGVGSIANSGPSISPGVQVAALSPRGVSEGSSVPTLQAVSSSENTESSRTYMAIAPRAGISSMIGQSYLDVRPRYSAGVGARFSATDQFSFELGYTFSEYGIAMATNNPFVLSVQSQPQWSGASFNYESVAMKQNIIDAGMRFHLLDSETRVRPFLGAGGAYTKSFINFDSRILANMRQYTSIPSDYEVSGFLGYLSTGVDVKISRSISIGLDMRYYKVLSSSENVGIDQYNGAFYSPTSGIFPSSQGYPSDTAVAGSELARASFFSIMGNVSFHF